MADSVITKARTIRQLLRDRRPLVSAGVLGAGVPPGSATGAQARSPSERDCFVRSPGKS